MSSPEHLEYEYFEKSNSKIHNGILLLAHADHIDSHMNVHINGRMIIHNDVHLVNVYVHMNIVQIIAM